METISIAMATMKIAAAKLTSIKTLSLLSFIGGVAVTLGFSNLGGSKTSQHVYELRMYYVNEGKIDALIARFGDHTDAIFRRHNMRSIGFGVPKTRLIRRTSLCISWSIRAARRPGRIGLRSRPIRNGKR